MINESIYGAPDTWINAPYLGGGRMVTKGANFTGGTQYVNSSTLGVGNTQGKTPHGELIDRTICTVALGTESIYSHMSYYLITDTYTDDEQATEFFFAVNDGQRSFTTQRSFYDTNHPNFWKVYTPSTPYNYSDNTIPITDMNPQKLLYRLEVCPCKANGATAPYSYTQTSDGYIYISDYDNNVRNIKTDYPYIMAARLVPYIDTSANTTPSRRILNAAEAGFGIAINRDFTSIPNDDLKINYCQFRNCNGYGTNTIPLYGYRGYFPNSYCILLADTTDIQTAIVDYSSEKFIAHEYDSDFHEWLIKQAACFGVYVQAFGGTPDTVALDDDSIILGIIDQQGIGHGDYTRGAANRNNDIWNWDSYNEGSYDWTKPIDPTHYDTTTVFNTVNVFDTFIKYYALNDTQLQRLCTNIYTYINSIDTNVEDISKAITKTFYTNNPLDVVVSLKKFPFNIGAYMRGQGQLENIMLGHLDSGTQGYKVTGNYTVVDLGSYPCYEYFGGTFLDYMPYTYYDLIVPFCGSIRLDPAQFMGHTLRLKMAIDIYTGACTCYILSDNLCIDTISGNCSIDIPVSGIQSADFQNSMQNAITNVKNARLDSAAFNMRGNLVIGSALTGEIGGGALMKSKPFTAAGNALSSMFGTSLWSAVNIPSSLASSGKEEARNSINVNKAEYDLQHLETPFAMVGSQSAANSFTEETNARLIIYRPQFASDYDPTIYADCFGFATLENDTLNKYSGFTVAKINLNGVRCSDEERAIIESMFAQGVYL